MKAAKIVLIYLAFFCISAVAEEAANPDTLRTLGVKKFENSELIRSKKEKYVEYSWGKEQLKGSVERFIYKVPQAASEVEIADNLIDNLIELGFFVEQRGRISSYLVNYLCKSNPYGCEISIPDGQKFNGKDEILLRAKLALPTGEQKFIASSVSKWRPDKSLKVPKNEKNQSVEISKDQYLQIIDIISPKTLAIKMVENLDTISEALKKDGKINLYGILFEFDKSDIKPESEPIIRNIAEVLKAEPSLRLKVVGHTDNVGTSEYNKALSLKRAAAVIEKLKKDYQIQADRLSAVGEGSDKSISPNDTDEGMAKNRRVELIKL